MATIKTVSTFNYNNIEVELCKRVMRSGAVSYIVEVWLKFEEFSYTDFRSKDLAVAENHYNQLVEAVKDGWYP